DDAVERVRVTDSGQPGPRLREEERLVGRRGARELHLDRAAEVFVGVLDVESAAQPVVPGGDLDAVAVRRPAQGEAVEGLAHRAVLDRGDGILRGGREAPVARTRGEGAAGDQRGVGAGAVEGLVSAVDLAALEG